MAVAACDRDTLIENSSCIDCLSEREKRALLAYALATQADVEMTDELEVAACMQCVPDSRLLSMLVRIELEKAGLEGTSIEDLKEAISCVLCADMHRLKAMEVCLRQQIG